jgi:uncharacterized protein YbjQ (UPF0145 family)
MQVASGLAQDLMGLPESVKNSELRKLKTYNGALYSAVKQTMQDMRDKTRQQAGNAAVGSAQGQQQQQGGQQPAA